MEENNNNNADDSAVLTNEERDRIRRKLHSIELMHAFYPIKWFLTVFGRSPFEIIKKQDGTSEVRFKQLSPSSLYFSVTAVVTAVIFIMTTLGFVTMYFGYNKSPVKNRCGDTWEEYRLKRHIVPTSLTMSWLFLTFVGSLYFLWHGKEYVHYFNYWNRAVQIMDMSVATGARSSGIVAIFEYIIVCVIFLTFYVSKNVATLDEGAGVIANSAIRLFKTDIGYQNYAPPPSNETFSDCINSTTQLPRDILKLESTLEFSLWKIFGFVVQLYSLYGSRTFITQFKFFTILLKNAANCWNNRFKNAILQVPEDPEDENKRRLKLRLLMKDHLILVQLFKMTETAFDIILRANYMVIVVNLCFEMYFFSTLTGVDACEKVFSAIQTNPECFAPNGTNINLEGSPLFDDPCDPEVKSSLNNAIVALVLLIQTLFLFVSTSVKASSAYEEAMKGFDIVRRNGYMNCSTRKERNLVHSLVVSFARNNPLQISAGGYFVVNRTLMIIILGAVFTYFIILLQFRPGEIDIADLCIATDTSP